LFGVSSNLSLLNEILVNFGYTILWNDRIVVDIGESPLSHWTASEVGVGVKSCYWFDEQSLEVLHDLFFNLN